MVAKISKLDRQKNELGIIVNTLSGIDSSIHLLLLKISIDWRRVRHARPEPERNGTWRLRNASGGTVNGYGKHKVRSN